MGGVLEVRVMDYEIPEIYQRQRELNIRPIRHAVVGAGGIGAWISILSAMSGDDVHVFDDDILEIHNLNRLPFTVSDVGEKKVVVLERMLKKMGRKIHGYPVRITSAYQLSLVDPEFVTFATDRLPNIIPVITELEKELGIPFAVVNYDVNRNGVHLTIRFNINPANEFDVDPEQSGYTITPSWVAPPVFIASIVVYQIHRDPTAKYVISGNLGELIPKIKEVRTNE